MYAAARGHLKVVKVLLQAPGIDVDLQNMVSSIIRQLINSTGTFRMYNDVKILVSAVWIHRSYMLSKKGGS